MLLANRDTPVEDTPTPIVSESVIDNDEDTRHIAEPTHAVDLDIEYNEWQTIVIDEIKSSLMNAESAFSAQSSLMNTSIPIAFYVCIIYTPYGDDIAQLESMTNFDAEFYVLAKNITCSIIGSSVNDMPEPKPVGTLIESMAVASVWIEDGLIKITMPSDDELYAYVDSYADALRKEYNLA